MNVVWTPDLENQLRQLWSEHLSASQIAARMGGEVNRDCVLGKARRLNLARRAHSGGQTAPRGASPAWTPEREGELRTLWQTGLSAAEIGRAMGGFSRCAIAGKAHRMDLSARVVTAKTPAPRLAPVFIHPPAATLTDGSHVTLEHLTADMCRFPHGDPQHTDFHLCGQPKNTGLPYCAAHTTLCYVPMKRQSAEDREKFKAAQVNTGIARMFG